MNISNISFLINEYLTLFIRVEIVLTNSSLTISTLIRWPKDSRVKVRIIILHNNTPVMKITGENVLKLCREIKFCTIETTKFVVISIRILIKSCLNISNISFLINEYLTLFIRVEIVLTNSSLTISTLIRWPKDSRVKVRIIILHNNTPVMKITGENVLKLCREIKFCTIETTKFVFPRG